MDQVYHSWLEGVFLDFEGTLNDTRASGRLYARDFMAVMGQRYDVPPASWAGAIVKSLDDVRQLQDTAAQEPWPGYDAYRRRELILWLRSLYGAAGVELPPCDDDVHALARQLEDSIPVRFAPLAGAGQLIRDLSGRRLRLHIASGANSGYVSRSLADHGLLEFFAGVYGPDNLDTLKSGACFFRRAFAAAGCKPARCLVVDDSPGPVCWAVEAGARAIRVGPVTQTYDGESGGLLAPSGVVMVASLADVISAIDGVAASE
jgi:beta-phosphoglucomutase-like phosphatase (HAD superfamily)